METSKPGTGYADAGPRRPRPTTAWPKSIRANPIVDIPREMLLIMRVVGLLCGLGKHLDSRVDVVNTLLPYTQMALDGAKRSGGPSHPASRATAGC